MRTLSRRHFVLQSTAGAGVLAAVSRAAAEPRRIQSDPDDAGPLEAGAALADLTPPPGIPMWGYSNPDQISTGTLDPLFARALVLRTGGVAIAIISMDFGRMPMPPICRRVRDRARAFGVGEVIFSATHIHSGPIMELPDLPHNQAMESALADLLQRAANALQPVRVGVGRAPLDIAHNRRVVREGQCWMRWRNLDRLPSGPLDQELTVLHFESPTGESVATLAHYACHPVILASDNTRYSADWCGVMAREVQEATGAPCLFLQGAAGDINPYFDKMSLAEGAEEAVRAEGRKAAEAVFAALKNLDWPPADRNRIAHERAIVDAGLRYDFNDPSQTAILREAYGLMFEKYMAGLGESLPLPVDTLLLQDAIALTFHPGEPFVQFQIDFKARATAPCSLLCGYANDFHIYFPTIEAAIIGGYGASNATYVAVGTGERLLAESLTQVGRLQGAIGPLKGPGDLASQDWTPDQAG